MNSSLKYLLGILGAITCFGVFGEDYVVESKQFYPLQADVSYEFDESNYTISFRIINRDSSDINFFTYRLTAWDCRSRQFSTSDCVVLADGKRQLGWLTPEVPSKQARDFREDAGVILGVANPNMPSLMQRLSFKGYPHVAMEIEKVGNLVVKTRKKTLWEKVVD